MGLTVFSLFKNRRNFLASTVYQAHRCGRRPSMSGLVGAVRVWTSETLLPNPMPDRCIRTVVRTYHTINRVSTAPHVSKDIYTYTYVCIHVRTCACICI